MAKRRNEGHETWERLKNWARGQTASERLAAQLLRADGFTSIDPSHPLGGQDGLKDALCMKDDIKWIAAAYFPRGQKGFTNIKKKFSEDLLGVKENDADGLAFVTNQELKLSERKKLLEIAKPYRTELFHLERISFLLDSPQCYGIRLEFLDIEMTKEEQLAFIASRDEIIIKLHSNLDTIVDQLKSLELLSDSSLDNLSTKLPLSEIREFKDTLDSIVGYDPFSTVHFLCHGLSSPFHGSRISDLKVPLDELKEFRELLNRIIGYGNSFLVNSGCILGASGTIQDLRIPNDELKEFEERLDRVIEKLRIKKMLE